ncbi:MAG: cupredoxin domain-containing protein [Chloroflexi bacterium]|nr:cupredoxin domain-containing protein [Chloroflexota bacterium]
MTSRRSNRFLPPAIALVTVLLLTAACGGDDASPTATPAPSEDAATAPGDGPATFEIAQREDIINGIAASGSQRFEPNSFIVNQGQQVTFNITNEGLGWHNMRVAGSDGEFGNADDTLTDHEPRFVPGDTGTLVFTAPDIPGELKFRCDFHPDVMTGTIVVE